jgi:alcohol dehydrogenase class IV
MLKKFVLEMPPAIHFGSGVRVNLGELLPRFGKKVLLCTGQKWFSESGWKDRFLELLAPFQLLELHCPSGEPEVEGLNRLLAEARRFKPDAIVAVGGGSVMDTGKALSGLLSVKEKVEDFLEGIGRGLKISAPGVPWIAVPTTSGTGAEATKNAVLKSKAVGAKKSLRSPFLLAACALVDPELTVDAPLALSGMAGLDALTQLVESYVSKKSAPIPRALAYQAFPIMLQALHSIPEDPADLEARSGAAYGALCSGIALANSGLGAAHGFASGLGGMYDIPHGLICALFIRPVLRANSDLIRADCAALQAAAREQGLLDRSEMKMVSADPVQWLIEEFDSLLTLYELPENLKGFAVDSSQVSEIARRSSGSSMSGNPKELSQSERETILCELL